MLGVEGGMCFRPPGSANARLGPGQEPGAAQIEPETRKGSTPKEAYLRVRRTRRAHPDDVSGRFQRPANLSKSFIRVPAMIMASHRIPTRPRYDCTRCGSGRRRT